MRTAAAVLATAAVFVSAAAACGAGPERQGPVNGACRAQDLDAVIAQTGAGAGSVYYTILVSNRGGSGCILEGAPAAGLLDQAGNPSTDPSPAPGEPQNAEPVELAPGDQATTRVHYTSFQCRPNGTAGIAVELPNHGGELRVRFSSRGPAVGPGCYHGTIDCTAFEPYPPRPSTPEPAARLALALFGAPASAARGETLHFSVRVTDVSPAPVELGPPCPGYTVGLKPLSSKDTDLEHYVLDCGGAATLQPGQSASFQVEYRVPPGATAGGRTLVVSLDGYPVDANAQLTIT